VSEEKGQFSHYEDGASSRGMVLTAGNVTCAYSPRVDPILYAQLV